MTLFGHHVTRLFLLLMALDGMLFFAVLHILGVADRCSFCNIGSGVELAPSQTALLTGAFLLITTSLGLYNNDAFQKFSTFFKRFALAWLFVFVPAAALFALTNAAAGLPLGRLIVMVWLAISGFMLALLAVHVALVWWFGLSFMKKRILVFGDGRSADAVAEYVNGQGRNHFQHVETVRSFRALQAPPMQAGTLALKLVVSEPAPLSTVAEMLRANEIVVAVEDMRDLPVSELLECKLRGVEVIDALTFWEREAGRIDPAQLGAGSMVFSEGFILDQGRLSVKRALDLVISMALLVATLPITLLAALLIKLADPGPVFYRQERVGLNGRVFRLWKFRSMRVDAEREGVPQWAKPTDDRVTSVGRFIRIARIDEIPQVINVLAGDMSFIGPRPERPFFVEQLRKQIPHYDLRHRVRPGITGWAQVNYPYGASLEDARRKLAFDLYYLKHNDLLLDFTILVQTVRVILFAVGAR